MHPYDIPSSINKNNYILAKHHFMLLYVSLGVSYHYKLLTPQQGGYANE